MFTREAVAEEWQKLGASIRYSVVGSNHWFAHDMLLKVCQAEDMEAEAKSIITKCENDKWGCGPEAQNRLDVTISYMRKVLA